MGAGYSSMFYDTNIVSTAWDALHNVFLEDGKAGLQNGRGSQQAVVGRSTSENSTGGIRLLRVTDPKPISEEKRKQNREMWEKILQRASAQNYGGIVDSFVATGQKGACECNHTKQCLWVETGAEGRTGAVYGAIRATDPKKRQDGHGDGHCGPGPGDGTAFKRTDGCRRQHPVSGRNFGGACQERFSCRSAASANVFLSGYHGEDVRCMPESLNGILAPGRPEQLFRTSDGTGSASSTATLPKAPGTWKESCTGRNTGTQQKRQTKQKGKPSRTGADGLFQA